MTSFIKVVVSAASFCWPPSCLSGYFAYCVTHSLVIDRVSTALLSGQGAERKRERGKEEKTCPRERRSTKPRPIGRVLVCALYEVQNTMYGICPLGRRLHPTAELVFYQTFYWLQTLMNQVSSFSRCKLGGERTHVPFVAILRPSRDVGVLCIWK